jgi:two-component system chemotaxis response regulator CheB
MMPRALVVIGASWGGLGALTTLVGGLPADFGGAVVLVQHRSRDSTAALAEIIQDSSTLPVCEIEDKAPIVPGHVHVAPSDYHLLVESDHFSLSVDAPQRYSRPSIDVTFESAAHAFGRDAIGVILTGANADGSQGLRTVVDRGGRAIIQDPETAESPTMPKAALAAVPTGVVLPLDRIARELVRMTADPARGRPARHVGESAATRPEGRR